MPGPTPGTDGAPGPRIAVVGPARAVPEEVLDAAHEVGWLLAQAGALVVTGGLGGVMAAACRGAVEAGGASVGILPGRDESAANQWVTLPVPTGLGEVRNVLVVRFADAVVAVGGSWGTLSEVAFAMRIGTPVVTLRSWAVAGPARGPVAAETPEEAVRTALARARR